MDTAVTIFVNIMGNYITMPAAIVSQLHYKQDTVTLRPYVSQAVA